MQGARNPWLSVLANEDQTAWGWKRTCDFLNCWTSCYTALFGIYTVATICIACIRTFLSIFAEIMSPIVFSIIWIISPTMSPMYLDYFVTTSSPMYFWWRSWTWKLFRIRFACFRIQFLPDHIMIHSCLVWFPWWLRHGAMEPFEATLFRVSDDRPDCRINTF